LLAGTVFITYAFPPGVSTLEVDGGGHLFGGFFMI